MKRLLLILSLIILLPYLAFAQSGKVATLEWEQDAETTARPDFSGWKLYMSETAGTYTTTPFVTIPYAAQQTTYTSTQTIPVPPGKLTTYYFVLTAFCGSLESGRSNEVSLTVDGRVNPAAPIQLRVTIGN